MEIVITARKKVPNISIFLEILKLIYFLFISKELISYLESFEAIKNAKTIKPGNKNK